MATIIDNKKGFKIVKVDKSEMQDKIASPGICDYCNSIPTYGYFVCVLNAYYCEGCYVNWINRAVNYPQDRHVEKRNFEYCVTAFGL